MLGTDFILDALVREGLDHLFMVPGGLIDAFYPALARQPALKPIVAAHEGGAAYMADGYARASGKFGAALCIGGPGLTNTVTAVAAASTDGSPLLVVSGESPTSLQGVGRFQDGSIDALDDVSILKPLTRFSTSVDNPQNLAHLLRHALTKLRSQPNAPAHLSIPGECLTAEIDARYEPLDPALTHPAVLSRAAAQASLPHFNSGVDGKQPVRIAILAGAGIEHAEAAAALLKVAETWEIPVATTLRAKGVFPEDHRLSLGVFGYAGTHHARIALLDTPPDLLLVLGSGLNQRDTMFWTLRLSPAHAICINLEALPMAAHISGSSVVGDAGAYLDFLLSSSNAIAGSLQASRVARKAWLDGIRSQPRLQEPENQLSAAVPIHPARIVSELRKALPRDGIVLIDSGAHRAFAAQYWEAYAPMTYISATNLGPMGWAIPAAIGVQCAQPQKKVAVITGDGCMHMHGMEVATAARYKVPVVYVVFNNDALGNIWYRAHKMGPVPEQLTHLPDVDWSAFARSLGANGITVTDPAELGKALSQALENDGPTVVDVKTDKKFLTPVADWNAASAAWSYHE